MKQNRKHIPILIFLLLNLLISANLCYALPPSVADSELTIGPCTNNCLTLSVPSTLALYHPASTGTIQFISNTNKNLYFYSNYNSELPGGKLSILNAETDAIPTGFRLSVSASSPTNSTDPTSFIPYSQVGIASFNNSITRINGSIDSNRVTTDSPIESSIDPVVTGATTEPFDQSTLENHLANGDAIENYYTYFDGAGADSNSLDIISRTPDDNNSMGRFEFGLSAIVKIPADSINAPLGLKDGTYDSILTFTLTTI